MCRAAFTSGNIYNYMAPRLFWFLAGGASAFWWIRKRENDTSMWEQRLATDCDQPKSFRDCMKHSWYTRRRRALEEGAPTDQDVRRELDDVAEAKERLIATVKSGIRTVMDTVIGIETTFKEERADLIRRRIEQRSRSIPSPATPETAPVIPGAPDSAPSISRASEKAQPTLPTYAPEPEAPAHPDPTMSAILVALENINSKLGAASPSQDSKDNNPPRIV